MAKKSQSFKILGLIGMAGVFFYFLHLILGQINYKNYDAASQTVFELTSKGSSSRFLPLMFFLLYGLCQSIFSFGMFALLRDKFSKYFYAGSLSFFLLHIISFVGFALFPAGLVGWKNTMHITVTILVMALAIISFIMFSINFLKIRYMMMAALSMIATMLVIFGGVLSRLVSNSSYGYAHRISFFAIVVYSGIMALWIITHRPKALSWY